MRSEIAAFQSELEELGTLLERLGPDDWRRATPFKRWTVWDVIAHLHWSDQKAVMAIRDPDAFQRDGELMAAALKRGTTLLALTAEALGPLAPEELVARWRETGEALCGLADALAPTTRIGWYGPDMGVRMFISARQMETWAHAQDIYDLLGRERLYDDRLENIAVLGVRTFGWTFANRRLPVPTETPAVSLRAPSGAHWEWNTPNDRERIEGEAADFCHVVTQGRHVTDTRLVVVGAVATRWMAMAQCFAGPPADPPPPGSRSSHTPR